MTDEAAAPRAVTANEQLSTLFELGREVTSVLDLHELLAKIPQLIARLTEFSAFSVYLLDAARDELTIAYSVGYPAGATMTLKVGQGVVGAAVEQGRPILVNDVSEEPRYRGPVPGIIAQLAVPLRRKGRVIGALNLLSERRGAFTSQDEALLRQFAAHVAVAIENARLFESERRLVSMLETLAEIGREVSSVLDLDELLTRIASLTRRIIDYRTFGILLMNEAEQRLEMKVALRYGDVSALREVPLGQGLVGWAAQQRQLVLVSDVSRDPRYIPAVEDVQSELVVPLLIQDRCIGVFDLESPELDAFTREHAQMLTLLASHAAVAIENARLYEQIRRSELRMERELRIARRVQRALQPGEVSPPIPGLDVAGRFASALELGGDLHDYRAQDADSLVVAVGDVAGKGVPAALYSAYAAELVRSSIRRRRYQSEHFGVAATLAAMNTRLHERQLEEYFCTLCYALFDTKAGTVTVANSGLPYPVRCSRDVCEQIELPGIPLGAFERTTYDEVCLPLAAGDVFVFCSDGIFEALNEDEEEFGAARLIEVVHHHRGRPASAVVDAIFDAVRTFRGGAPQSDDMTAVAVTVSHR
ncbi:MAG: GAF domain-containing protein [Acidimicrobiia bacterium]|nr:GAF domain-containing protein [Acidimicrobiia bacterium]